MSGIVGIYHRDGAPIERATLDHLTQFLAYRGPDGLGLWSSGSIGFGHTLLRTSSQAELEKQPLASPSTPRSRRSDEFSVAIVADVRLDCRVQLRDDLAAAGQTYASGSTDPELLVAAYFAWGEDCVQHLRGDFAFAVWDSRHQKLFCARDHFGLKPFYYVDRPALFLFGNTLHCLLLHPSVSGELHDTAIADFLLFGMNYDVSTTAFRDIRRLPPAHTLTVSPMDVIVRRYWQPPVTESIRYRDERDYLIHFTEILRDAVRDRVQTERVGILLSGGLDSGTVAAAARDLLRDSSQPRELTAYTVTFESLLGDREGHYARKTAAFLGIPISTIELDEQRLAEQASFSNSVFPEPVMYSLFPGSARQFAVIAKGCRVALSGEGADNLMDFQMWPYVRRLAQTGQWNELFKRGFQFLAVRQFPWRGIRARAASWFGANPDSTPFPEWISPELERALDLRNRWTTGNPLPRTPAHPLVPRGYASLFLPQWANMFETEDPGVTGSHVEVRYPFLDLRMVHYLLALPPFPWFFQKTLIRHAMVGKLPEEVRIRAKTPLQGDPLASLVQRSIAALRPLPWQPEMQKFVGGYTFSAFENQVFAAKSESRRQLALHPLILNFWLQSLEPFRYKRNSGIE